MVTLSVDFIYFTGKMERIGHVEKSSNEAILKIACTVGWIFSCGRMTSCKSHTRTQEICTMSILEPKYQHFKGDFCAVLHML